MRYAIRRLIHQPGFSLVVILTLALGIGANTAIFSLVNAVLLRSLPYDHPERLVTLDHYYPDLNNLQAGFAVPSYKEITERTHVFDTFAVAGRWNVNLTGTGEPEKLTGSYATADFFKVFCVARCWAARLLPGDCREGFKNVVVLGYGLWERRFGSDRDIVGKKVVLGGEPFSDRRHARGFYSLFNRRVDVWGAGRLQEQHGTTRERGEFLFSLGRCGRAFRSIRRLASHGVRRGLAIDHPSSHDRTWTIETRTFNDYDGDFEAGAARAASAPSGRAADCLREHREPAACALRSPDARDGGARGHRRDPARPGPAVADREPASRGRPAPWRASASPSRRFRRCSRWRRRSDPSGGVSIDGTVLLFTLASPSRRDSSSASRRHSMPRAPISAFAQGRRPHGRRPAGPLAASRPRRRRDGAGADAACPAQGCSFAASRGAGRQPA